MSLTSRPDRLWLRAQGKPKTRIPSPSVIFKKVEEGQRPPKVLQLRKMRGDWFDTWHPQAQVHLEPQAQLPLSPQWPPGGSRETAAPLVLAPQSRVPKQTTVARKEVLCASVPCPCRELSRSASLNL